MEAMDLVRAVFLWLAIEGAFFAFAPGAMRGVLARLAAEPEEQLRLVGLIVTSLGTGALLLLSL